LQGTYADDGQRVSDGGTALMPLQTHPFSPHVGWVTGARLHRL